MASNMLRNLKGGENLRKLLAEESQQNSVALKRLRDKE